jgi:hypothetical protein
MRENFAESFVDHRYIGFAPQAVPEFAFHHAEGGFDVGTLVAVLQELRPPELKIMVHLFPRSAAVPPMIGSERDEWCGPDAGDYLRVTVAGVALCAPNKTLFIDLLTVAHVTEAALVFAQMKTIPVRDRR